MINNNCTECGAVNIKLARRYGPKTFCTQCYTKYFKKDECNKCGKTAKLPTFERRPICIKCERDVPCTTCGKKDYSVGAITDTGPVCPSCAIKVRGKKKCEECGKLSAIISRHAHLPHELKVCLKCSRKGNGTCQKCERNRPLFKDNDGAMICKKCMLYGELECQKCGDAMPAGYGKICKACYWSGLFTRKVVKAEKLFTSSAMAGEFKSFSIWLDARLGSNVASNKINNYTNFFLKLETIWNQIPNYSQLIDTFGASGLRKVELPIKWMIESKGLRVDLKYKDESTEYGRIDDLFESLNCNEMNTCMLIDYKEYIFEKIKTGKTSVRSARLALRPAVSLANSCGNNLTGISQTDLDSYLNHKPGQKSAITGFINFINDRFESSLRIMVNEKKPELTEEKN